MAARSPTELALSTEDTAPHPPVQPDQLAADRLARSVPGTTNFAYELVEQLAIALGS